MAQAKGTLTEKKTRTKKAAVKVASPIAAKKEVLATLNPSIVAREMHVSSEIVSQMDALRLQSAEVSNALKQLHITTYKLLITTVITTGIVGVLVIGMGMIQLLAR